MADIDKLRPEVAAALRRLCAPFDPFIQDSTLDSYDGSLRDARIAATELMRLANENAQLRDVLAEPLRDATYVAGMLDAICEIDGTVDHMQARDAAFRVRDALQAHTADTLRPEVREAINRTDMTVEMFDTLVTVNRDDYDIVLAELRRLADENARLNKIESLATEQRLQMEDVELYLMDVSQPDDEDADWCDRMKSAIELLVQDCNDAVGQKNKAEAELAALKTRIAASERECVYRCSDCRVSHVTTLQRMIGKRVRLVVEE